MKAWKKKIGGKIFRLYKSGGTDTRYGIDNTDIKEIKEKLKRKFYIRIEKNVWGNTYIWIRRK